MGPDVRSDLWVAVDLRESGGLELALRSRVEPYYGELIRAQVRQVLEALAVTHARVEIDDQGALPFVIAARIEAAAIQAGSSVARVALPVRTVPLPPSSSRDRPRRSRLYLPGAEPKFFINAGLHEPDAVILDLEDSVHVDHKDAARLVVRNALRVVDFRTCERMVRINQHPQGLVDLRAIVPEHPDVILVPKVEDPVQVRAVDKAITEFLGQDDAPRPCWILPILESAVGIERAFEIARASERVIGLTIGLEDYTADLGVPKTDDGAESLYARRRLVNAARAAGLQAIDSVYGDIGNLDGLRAWAARARALGFDGMGCVHPRQIRPIHAAFAPSQDEIDKAVRIVAAFHDAEAKGIGVVSLGSKMIDPPVVLRARRLVELARTLGLVARATPGDA